MPVRQAAAVALIHGDMVLLGKRARFYKGEAVKFGGYWSVFGGAVEPGETPREAAAREVKEETGLIIDSSKLEHLAVFFEPNLDFIVYTYNSDERSTPVLDQEHLEARWFNINSLSSFTGKIDPKIVKVLVQHHSS